MSKPKRQRNPAVERRERASFIVLQHIHCLSAAGGIPLSARRVIAELGLSSNEGFASLQHLAREGLIIWDMIDAVELTVEGRDYVERGAGRRRTVRTSTHREGERGGPDPHPGGWRHM